MKEASVSNGIHCVPRNPATKLAALWLVCFAQTLILTWLEFGPILNHDTELYSLCLALRITVCSGVELVLKRGMLAIGYK